MEAIADLCQGCVAEILELFLCPQCGADLDRNVITSAHSTHKENFMNMCSLLLE